VAVVLFVEHCMHCTATVESSHQKISSLTAQPDPFPNFSHSWTGLNPSSRRYPRIILPVIMASGFELVGLIGAIDSTINVTSRIATFVHDIRHADDEADNLCAKLRLQKIALEQLQKGMKNHFKDNAPSVEEKAFLEDLEPRLQALNVSLQGKLLAMAKPKKFFVSQVAWAVKRKASIVAVTTEIMSWTNALHIVISAIQINKQPESEGSQVQFGRLLRFFRRGDTGEEMEVEEESMKWKREDVRIIKELAPLGRHRAHMREVCDDQFLASAIIRENVDAIVEWVYEPGSRIIYKADDAWILSRSEKLQKICRVLSLIDPQQTKILKCLGYFVDDRADADKEFRFGIIYGIPDGMKLSRGSDDQPVVTTLEKMLMKKTFSTHALDRRLGFARDIATAVLYIHAMGWVHKDVCPRNIILLGNLQKKLSDLPTPYLVGSQFARKVFWSSDRRGEESWYYNIYRHPCRHQKENNTRFGMSFDTYSLGVVLMELALASLPNYRPLTTMNERFQEKKPEDLHAEIVKLVDVYDSNVEGGNQGVQVVMGRKYRDIVLYCLNRTKDDPEESIAFVKNVWIQLNDLELAVAH